MRILFDHQIMDAQMRGGVSRYFYKLVSTIQGERLAGIQLPPMYTENEYFRPLLSELRCRKVGLGSLLVQAMRKLPLANKEVERAWRRAKARLNRRASIETLKKRDFDLFHPTYYDPYFLDHLNGKPFVLTIYDMIHEIHPEYFKSQDKTREHKALLARAAARIIAISSSTKADIVKYMGIDADKIEVIYPANPLAAGSEDGPIPKMYVLYVGGRDRYKNFRMFFLAFANLAATFPDLHLVCVHQKGFNQAELDLMKESGLKSRCLHVSASDERLAFLYRNASLFVYPSLYEGFGLPVLEAFAHGCPVILSQTSCFPEIAGDAAMYFDPSSVPSMETTLARVLSDDALRRILVRRGQERLKDFSWVKTAEQTVSLYRSAIMGPP